MGSETRKERRENCSFPIEWLQNLHHGDGRRGRPPSAGERRKVEAEYFPGTLIVELSLATGRAEPVPHRGQYWSDHRGRRAAGSAPTVRWTGQRPGRRSSRRLGLFQLQFDAALVVFRGSCCWKVSGPAVHRMWLMASGAAALFGHYDAGSGWRIPPTMPLLHQHPSPRLSAASGGACKSASQCAYSVDPPTRIQAVRIVHMSGSKAWARIRRKSSPESVPPTSSMNRPRSNGRASRRRTPRRGSVMVSGSASKSGAAKFPTSSFRAMKAVE